MFNHYADLIALTSEPPRWFDEHAVPRFVDFEPIKAANIYAQEVALVEIGCQSCGCSFNVAFSSGSRGRGLLSVAIVENTLHYGDPPNMNCCPAGPTMNSEPRRVLEYWTNRGAHNVDTNALRARLVSDKTAIERHLGNTSEVAELARPWARVFVEKLSEAIDALDARISLRMTRDDRGWIRDRRLEAPIYPKYLLDLTGSAWHLAPQ